MAKNVMASLEKWRRNMAASGEAVKNGVASVTESPGVKANANKEKLRRNFLQALDSGKVERGNSSYTVDDWKKSLLTKGISNMQTGAANLSARSQKAITEQLQIANEVAAAVAGMPTDTFDQAMEKAKAAARMMMERARG